MEWKCAQSLLCIPYLGEAVGVSVGEAVVGLAVGEALVGLDVVGVRVLGLPVRATTYSVS